MATFGDVGMLVKYVTTDLIVKIVGVILDR